MAEIISFVGGCVFAIVLVVVSTYLAYRILELRQELAVRREEQIKRIHQKYTPSVPEGGVIKPKTLEDIEAENEETLDAFNNLMR